MKTKLIAIIACVCLTQAASAQLNFGIKAGTNITKIDGKSFDEEFKYGYLAGGFVEIGLGKKIAIQPEVLFNQYQTKVSSEFSDIYENAANDVTNGNVKLNYLSIPLMLNYKAGKLLTLQAGPQYSILLDKNKDLLQNGQDAFKSGDFSMAGGATINLGKLKLNGRYVVGLNSINDIDNQDSWKSQAIQLSLGLAF
jgi:hypothetical protein